LIEKLSIAATGTILVAAIYFMTVYCTVRILSCEHRILSQENISHELLAKVWVISMLNMKYLIK